MTNPLPSDSSPPDAALLAGVFQSLSEGVLIAAPDFGPAGFRIEHVNDALCQISGYTATELIGQGHAKLHVERSDVKAQRHWHSATEQPETHSDEGFLHTKAGKAVFVAWTFSWLADEHGRRAHVIITYRDMTANRRLQDALVHSQRLDAVGRLAGGVAHDFNNLLSVINGYCEILHQTVGENEKAQREIQEIHQAGHQASALVRQLLAFGRRQALDPRVISPNRLVRENTDILSRLLGDERSFELSLAEEVGNIRVDPTQMQQVLLNLVINARDATPAGGRIIVTTENRTVAPALNRRITDMQPGNYVVLTVNDNGCGMDEATQTVLFEPFFTTKEAGVGTGLGLALVYGIVRQSGGHIFVRSKQGVGTTFEIFLPRSEEDASPAIGSLAPLPVTRGRETLLIVEADHVVRKMIAGIFTADGYDVMDAPSAATAIVGVKHRQTTVHLIIADHTESSGEMERMIKTLHENHRGLRVLCTPNRDDASALPWLSGSHQSILPKPFALSTLLQDVRKLLDIDDQP
ncbi:ATP-binding response regulator [Synoicihabitans lomoniglobus]|uniref:histidine kinase n=1 Tax=Synoicihabitans lomoniglobus TaxID=2909285 RepID=A0AAE9ZWV2_9BACT|nr:ATP-binding protein [Opitutaceae bacterium LMO-M01]WED64559.1 ATP-binding protein [Opitutaceae bacterium LMO-M01]